MTEQHFDANAGARVSSALTRLRVDEHALAEPWGYVRDEGNADDQGVFVRGLTAAGQSPWQRGQAVSVALVRRRQKQITFPGTVREVEPTESGQARVTVKADPQVEDALRIALVPTRRPPNTPR